MFADRVKLRHYIVICEIGIKNAKCDEARQAFSEALNALIYVAGR